MSICWYSKCLFSLVPGLGRLYEVLKAHDIVFRTVIMRMVGLWKILAIFYQVLVLKHEGTLNSSEGGPPHLRFEGIAPLLIRNVLSCFSHGVSLALSDVREKRIESIIKVIECAPAWNLFWLVILFELRPGLRFTYRHSAVLGGWHSVRIWWVFIWDWVSVPVVSLLFLRSSVGVLDIFDGVVWQREWVTSSSAATTVTLVLNPHAAESWMNFVVVLWARWRKTAII